MEPIITFIAPVIGRDFEIARLYNLNWIDNCNRVDGADGLQIIINDFSTRKKVVFIDYWQETTSLASANDHRGIPYKSVVSKLNSVSTTTKKNNQYSYLNEEWTKHYNKLKSDGWPQCTSFSRFNQLPTVVQEKLLKHNRTHQILNYQLSEPVREEIITEVESFDLSWADLVIVKTREVLSLTGKQSRFEKYEAVVKKFFKNKNIIFIASGIPVEIYHNLPKNVCMDLDWMYQVRLANDSPMDLNSVSFKPYLFDALLGAPGNRPHRYRCFDLLKKLNLLDKSLVNFSTSRLDVDESDKYVYRSPELDKFENPDIDFSKSWSDPSAFRNGKGFPKSSINGWSVIIPEDIYKHTWFSLVTETAWNHIYFLTEKTFKCLCAKRIFLLWAAPGSLGVLRDFGFKTFDGIIDESYDLETNLEKKSELIGQQMLFLSQSDPVDLYHRAAPILEHNFRMAYESTRQLEYVDFFIKSHIRNLFT